MPLLQNHHCTNGRELPSPSLQSHGLLAVALCKMFSRVPNKLPIASPIPTQSPQADCVLVDEASMVDLSLASALLSALPPGCQLILVGDPDQLPPVGRGALLPAAIESRALPVLNLQQIFRQAAQSAIVRSAHQVGMGADGVGIWIFADCVVAVVGGVAGDPCAFGR